MAKHFEGPKMFVAAVAAGRYPDVKTATQKMIHLKDTTMPDQELVAKYELGYQTFLSLYPALYGKNK